MLAICESSSNLMKRQNPQVGVDSLILRVHLSTSYSPDICCSTAYVFTTCCPTFTQVQCRRISRKINFQVMRSILKNGRVGKPCAKPLQIARNVRMQSSTRGTNLVVLTVSVQNLMSEILSKSSGNDAGPQTRSKSDRIPGSASHSGWMSCVEDCVALTSRGEPIEATVCC